MAYFSTISKFLTPALLIVLVAGGFLFYSSKQTSSRRITALEKELKVEKEKNESAAYQNKQLTQEFETLYVEKNGTANKELTTATQELFSTVFTYRTDREEDSIKSRKEKATEVTNQTALNGLFPKDAENSKPSVLTISRMTKDPEVYLMPSNEKELTSLIVVHYAVSIAGSDEQVGTFMYKAVFSPLTSQFTEIQNIGEVNIP
ncbi:hypothetical protein A5819_003518 [Enterococcus sp. 7E2_DIV0204]|uniref:hypothetical protein n=1 Tax=unclassified Enterococcus TaxID=2608891 RepID=UPI000A341005|nr:MULTISPECIES: hypothetical protein [unclassified Enterococcus]OTN83968.1 hypothetical protein A5819_003518 [Enterococcus sp. 7E2_DIV0204]OTP46876.1 hypothetical protein A5884_003754 [Enterococcus sp. 7D2_DIV0200]